MVAVKEISWEEATAPDFEHTTRHAFRAAVDQVAARAKATLPECNGRVEKAVAIVLAGDVELLADGHARVASQCQGTTVYRMVNGTCDCPDFPRAPASWCKHRIAAGIQRRAMQAVQTTTAVASVPAAGPHAVCASRCTRAYRRAARQALHHLRRAAGAGACAWLNRASRPTGRTTMRACRSPRPWRCSRSARIPSAAMPRRTT